jgi:hypothetical protein
MAETQTIRYLYDVLYGKASVIVESDGDYEVTAHAKGKIQDSIQKFFVLDTINAKGEIQDSIERIRFLSDSIAGKATVTLESATGIISAKGEIQDSVEKIGFTENIVAKGVIVDEVKKIPSIDPDEQWTKLEPPETEWTKT